MEKIKLSKGQVLHKKGDSVSTLEILLAGALTLTDGDDVEVSLGSGSIVGPAYVPAETYRFDYIAREESTLIVLDYESEDDIVEAVTGTPAIAPVIAAASMEAAVKMLNALSSAADSAAELCKDIKYNYNEYQFMCVQLQQQPENFVFISALAAPEPAGTTAGWEADLCRAFCDRRALLEKEFYPLDTTFCLATVMRAASIERKICGQLEDMLSFINNTKLIAKPFTEAFYAVKSRVDTNARSDSDAAPLIHNALDMILAFSGVDTDIADTFRKDIKTYTEVEDRWAKSDEMRRLRMSIADGFYRVYEAAFFKSMETSLIPAEVRMFFLFGFVDETLAGAANTEYLYRTAVGWENDPEGQILCLYDWLQKIYQGEAVPSKNEFDNDWPESLREDVRTGVLTQQQADELLVDNRAMVNFEIRNMFTSANKATYGRLASFVPVFNAQDVVRPLEKSIASPALVRAAFDKVLAVDFGCFYRPTLTSFSEFKIPHFVYNAEVRPYVILMPNFGSRGLMWQEIEGMRRVTPAHMMLSIFHSEDLDATIVHMCALFRWEMCRRIQGVRYADISEPSLTSEYMNYLQFYRKNGYLSSDIKERIKLTLQKARNDYKTVFVADYEKYIQSEAYGMPKLNKIAREILFKYCTFSQRFRAERGHSPQYQPLMDRWNVAHNTRTHNLDLILRKIQRMNPDAVPAELLGEIKFVNL
ncbi:hypothetical protein FZ041_01170 [Selenomonas caprae]|uniref:Cyclic nucleotide-binding domain-containing protein n=1 Tax=Selenomonas caprae TaxID=2606905 RepID=A0A5D6WRJ8_9FIRM|nr:cyclic nucleotide-binding domain-containing protein [Selenomonas caprae]TYZ30716.1 hypothetical protein FZ041_01170 [Selenomonas caprae]